MVIAVVVILAATKNRPGQLAPYRCRAGIGLLGRGLLLTAIVRSVARRRVNGWPRIIASNYEERGLVARRRREAAGG
jgi:hypothetical protein